MIDTSKHIIDIVKYRAVWMWLTVALVLPGVLMMIYSMVVTPDHLPLKVGIDYTGGTVLQYGIDKTVPNHILAVIREKLVASGIENPTLQIINSGADSKGNATKDIIVVRTKFIGEGDVTTVPKISTVMSNLYPKSELLSTNSVGPTLGNELFKNSLIALLLACVGIIAYLTLRFQLDFAVSAVLAVLHDMLFVMGMFSILGYAFNVQVDGLFITAMLTVMGFSVHDTIVVFDRIRENLRYYAKKMTFGEIVNASVNQTFTRSINTSLTTLITLFALYFFGGVTTKEFVLAMILGIAIGTYSSIFFASMLIDFWRERKSKATA